MINLYHLINYYIQKQKTELQLTMKFKVYILELIDLDIEKYQEIINELDVKIDSLKEEINKLKNLRFKLEILVNNEVNNQPIDVKARELLLTDQAKFIKEVNDLKAKIFDYELNGKI
ncbi:hypothetical protein GE118_00460 [Mycoplasma sp. NEAQ87857]|uniref:hypothetical protein n=1 Tax=Mycoplasma sp. NEAQ87857 TaxID=2683967 RepID=UPI001316890E|nr:hypothetical protein [Mycoplasma sp. NEAQ87857]QGZ97276.1 hypothetical protein GE118_00460 [Mycoplasma sp. NEAQ87857]